MGHRSRPRFYEIYFMRDRFQALTAKHEQHPNAGRDKERGHFTTWIVESSIKNIEVFHAVKQIKSGATLHSGIYFRQTTKVIKRPTDNKNKLRVVSLHTYKIIGIGQYRLMTYHYALGMARSAGSKKDVGHIGR